MSDKWNEQKAKRFARRHAEEINRAAQLGKIRNVHEAAVIKSQMKKLNLELSDTAAKEIADFMVADLKLREERAWERENWTCPLNHGPGGCSDPDCYYPLTKAEHDATTKTLEGK